MNALRDFIREQGSCVVGLDFPFGLPELLVDEATWELFACAFSTRYDAPEAFQKACVQKAGRELRRATDEDAETPWSPYNLRLFKQTYYGIGHVLAPLVSARNACVLPMQDRAPGIPWLVEVCPASTLKKLNLYRSYKGGAQGKRRRDILRGLEEKGLSFSDERLRTLIAGNSGGDALDSVIAAFTVFKALDDGSLTSSLKTTCGPEGWVYR